MSALAHDSWFYRFKKNLRIFRAFATASFQADLEYRANFLSRILTDVFWYAAQILTFETLFVHTQRIGDWDRDQTRVFLGLLFFVDAIYMVLFHDNLDHLSDKVRKGELDLILAKPVNSRLMVSCQRISTALIGNTLISIAWLTWSLSNLPNFDVVRLLWLLILVPCGVCIFYCIRFLFASLAIILTRADAVQYIWFSLYKLGMRPDSIYAPWLRYILMSFVPVAVIASVPASSLLEPSQYGLFAYVVFLTGFFVWVSGKFWKYALSKYTSASS